MKKIHFSLTPERFFEYVFALLTVVITTIPLVLIGRDTLGEAVIALLYLVPVGWSAARWGQGPAILAAIAAALTFDYFFIPPFQSFTVGRLEGWLVLAIFLAVAIIVIGRIQSSLSRANKSEKEAIFMYELSTALAGQRTQESVCLSLANHLQQMFQARLVEVSIQPGNQSPGIFVKAPPSGSENDQPDAVLPIIDSRELVGEIRIWRGDGWLPPEDSRLLQNFAMQASQALERARYAEAQAQISHAENQD
jgi:K+-sensing histidine kinase KdpD